MTVEPARFGLPLVTGLLLAGVLLRVAMGFESFWLDEAWSHWLATTAHSPTALFEIRHDNNHLLNSLYLYAVDDFIGTGHWIGFRVPALVAGCLSLGVLWQIGRGLGSRTAGLVLLLTATSFPLISASAQARGYSLAILCSLVYFALSSPVPGRGEWGRRVGLAVVAGLGLLSHATFVYALGAVVLWSAWRDRSAGAVALRHAVPLLLAAGLYAFFYAGLELGGGPDYDRFVTLRQALAQTMALPRRGPLTWVATGLAVLLVGRGLVLLARRSDGLAVFFASVLVVVPGVVVAVSDPQLLYARYLLAAFPWFYLLVAFVLADAWDRGTAGRVCAAALVTFFVGSNLLHTARVLAEGRNDYAETLAYIDRHTDGPRIEIGSDHDFRNSTLLRFYAPRLASGRKVVYVPRREWGPSGPEWYLRHDWKAGHDPEARFSPRPGLEYERVVSFEHGPGDGFQWFVYRRVAAPRVRPRASPDAP